jgi:hypothetical protein
MNFDGDVTMILFKHRLRGTKEGQSEIFVDNLPGKRICTRFGFAHSFRFCFFFSLLGYPDNIWRAPDGTFWIGIVELRSPLLPFVYRIPGLARLLYRSEALVSKIRTPSGHLAHFDVNGDMIESFHDTMGIVAQELTGAVGSPDGSEMWLGSFSHNCVAVVKTADLKLE